MQRGHAPVAATVRMIILHQLPYQLILSDSVTVRGARMHGVWKSAPRLLDHLSGESKMFCRHFCHAAFPLQHTPRRTFCSFHFSCAMPFWQYPPHLWWEFGGGGGIHTSFLFVLKFWNFRK